MAAATFRRRCVLCLPLPYPQVEIHELEERKNLHVNDLIRSHEASFAEIKKYYNEITKDNLKSIKKFKVCLWWWCV